MKSTSIPTVAIFILLFFTYASGEPSPIQPISPLMEDREQSNWPRPPLTKSRGVRDPPRFQWN